MVNPASVEPVRLRLTVGAPSHRKRLMRLHSEEHPTMSADELARAMAGRGLSTFDVASEANVDVDDVRSCLTQCVRLVSSQAFARLCAWVTHQKTAHGSASGA